MTAADFRAALAELGWSQSTATARLGVANRQRVSEWARGRRPLPPYVALAVGAHLDAHRERRRATAMLARIRPEGSDPNEGQRVPIPTDKGELTSDGHDRA